MPDNIIGKKIAIFGLARSGQALINFLQNHYRDIEIYIFDDNLDSLKEFENRNNIFIKQIDEIDPIGFNFIVASPGINLEKSHNPIIQFAKNHSILIICDIELFYLLHSDKKFIAITGTNGKSTTTALIGHIFNNSNLKIAIGGNIGQAIFTLPPADIYILELSSYQLDLLNQALFDIGVLLNITSDHLERYNYQLENYIDSKKQIIDHSKLCIIAIDNEVTNNIYYILKKTKNLLSISSTQILDFGLSLVNKNLYIDNNYIGNIENENLFGEHNQENILAAIATALSFDLKYEEIKKYIASFISLNHRLQKIATYKNITFINDSKATSAEATLNALKCFNNIYLILGGVAKTDGLIPITSLLHKIKKAYLIGSSIEEFSHFLTQHNINYEISNHLTQATDDAYCDALNDKEAVNIILSPACASFDQFKDFEDRGMKFIEIVNKKFSI